MCSSPKGSGTKPLTSSHVESLSGDMSSADYRNMVHRANESYGYRQQELIEYRKTHKNKLLLSRKKQPKKLYLRKLHLVKLFLEKLKVFFSQTPESQAIDSK